MHFQEESGTNAEKHLAKLLRNYVELDILHTHPALPSFLAKGFPAAAAAAVPPSLTNGLPAGTAAAAVAAAEAAEVPPPLSAASAAAAAAGIGICIVPGWPILGLASLWLDARGRCLGATEVLVGEEVAGKSTGKMIINFVVTTACPFEN